jgi:transcriptional regulator with XRE-family HTH domain
MVNFGAKLKYARLLKRLSIEELAARAGVSPGGISSLETGRISNPQYSTIRDLAKSLGIPVEYFFREDAAIPRDFLDFPGRVLDFLAAEGSEAYLEAAVAAWENRISPEAFKAFVKSLKEVK